MKKLLLSIICSVLLSGTAFSQIWVSANMQDTPCNSNCSGVLTITAGGTGGVYPLSIIVNGNFFASFMTSFQVDTMCPGIYDISVLDATGFDISGPMIMTVTSIPNPITSVLVQNASCPTCNDGSITATTLSGEPPYTYSLSNGSTGSVIQNLLPGMYILLTVDINGCTDHDTINIGSGATSFYTLSGTCYLDSNQNGIKDGGEPPLGGQFINVSPAGLTALTDVNGEYQFTINPGNWDVSYQLNSGWNLTSPATQNVNLTTASINNLDFGLIPTANTGSGYVATNSGYPRCLLNVPYYPTFVNTGHSMLSGSFTFTHDPLQSFLSSSLVPDLVTGNSYTFNFSNLPPGGRINPVITLLEPAGDTSVICSTAASVSNSFGFSSNYANNYTQYIFCSFDPNDKNVDPAGVGASHFVEMDSWLNYQIRFQNTGTDTAFTVVILDTLDAALDRSTLSITGSSHPVNVTYNSSGEVTFRFNNILLPDSNINEPASHGFVSYRIKGLSSNPDPTPVNNTAYIYFDLNSHVVTNSTLTTLSDNLLGLHNESGSENWFSLFPNPSSGDVIVKLNADKTGDYNMNIFDTAGRLVIQKELKGQDHLSVKTEWLNPGIYIIELKSNDTGAKAHKKLIRY